MTLTRYPRHVIIHPINTDATNATVTLTKFKENIMNQPLAINDKVTISDKPFRVYNIIDEQKLVCFGAISAKTGKDLSSHNPHNILSMKFDLVERYLKLQIIVKL